MSSRSRRSAGCTIGTSVGRPEVAVRAVTVESVMTWTAEPRPLVASCDEPGSDIEYSVRRGDDDIVAAPSVTRNEAEAETARRFAPHCVLAKDRWVETVLARANSGATEDSSSTPPGGDAHPQGEIEMDFALPVRDAGGS